MDIGFDHFAQGGFFIEQLAEAAAAQALRERLQNADAELTAMTMALEEQRARSVELHGPIPSIGARQQEADTGLEGRTIRHSRTALHHRWHLGRAACDREDAARAVGAGFAHRRGAVGAARRVVVGVAVAAGAVHRDLQSFQRPA